MNYEPKYILALGGLGFFTLLISGVSLGGRLFICLPFMVAAFVAYYEKPFLIWRERRRDEK